MHLVENQPPHQLPHLGRVSSSCGRLIGYVVVLLLLVCMSATEAQEQGSNPRGFVVEELLGLEPSEFAQLKSATRWERTDRFLNIALSYLEQMPFRRIPNPAAARQNTDSRPEESITQRRSMWLVAGPVQEIVRHTLLSEVDVAGEVGEGFIYECLVTHVGTERQQEPSPSGRTVRILTRSIPQQWNSLSWHAAAQGVDKWKTDDVALFARAVIVDVGDKSALPYGPIEDEMIEQDNKTLEVLPTGLAKRLEWPEADAGTILSLLVAADKASAKPEGGSKAQASTAQLGMEKHQAIAENQQEVLAAVANDWSRWGAAGFDLGLLPLLAAGQRRGLQPSDNEPFYQLLRSVAKESGRASRDSGTSDVSRDVTDGLPIQEMIRYPQKMVGRTFQAHLIVKQVTKVPSEPNDRAEQLGIPHYYLLHGLVQLPRPLRLKLDAERQLDYQKQFPVVVAIGELPPGLSVGDEVRQWVRGEVVFFKLWSYQSQRSQQEGVEQWAPLLIAGTAQVAPPPSDSSATWPIGWLLLIPLGLSLLFLLVSGLRRI